MMEIVHDIAPNAQLWFGGTNATSTPIDFSNRVLHLGDNGCKIIVDDISYSAGYSFFEEREISSSINQFIQSKNGCYISSTGNKNGNTISSNNYSVVDSSKKILFSNRDISFTTPADYDTTSKISITLQWADSWSNPINDFDLILYDDTNKRNCDTLKNRGSGFNPEEAANFLLRPGITYKTLIYWYNYSSTAAHPEIKVLIFSKDGYNLNLSPSCNSRQTIGHKIADNVISVAATSASSPNVIESFSSRGPAVKYSPASGTYFIIQQPKITAADEIRTYIGSTGNFDSLFYGTSAAAPQVAGIAALYFQKYPTQSYSDFLEKITGSTVTMSDGGSASAPNNISGFGRIDAVNLFFNSLTKDSSVTYSTNTNVIEKRLKGTITVSNNVILTIPANTVSSINGTVNFAGANAKIIVQGTLIFEKTSILNSFNIVTSGNGRLIDLSGNFVNVTIKQINSSGANIDTVKQWLYSKWNNLIPGNTYTFPTGNIIIKSCQNVINNEKYQNWQNVTSNVTNYSYQIIAKGQTELTAHFAPVYNATIKNAIEGLSNQTGGVVGFKDPWYIDTTTSLGRLNRGSSAFTRMYDNLSSPFCPGVNSNYLGVFLNRSVSSSNYYSMRIPKSQDIYLSVTGKTHKFYFNNWSAVNGIIDSSNNLVNGYYQTPVIFTGADAVIQANLKGTQLSNNSSVLSNNGQQKIARTYYGDLYMVYESMNHVWLEKSTDGGSTWQVWNDGKPLDSGEGKCPSIDSNGDILIVWQEKNGLVSDIKIACINPQNTNQVKISSLTPIGGLAFESPAYADNANPVIAFNPRNTFFVVWEKQPYLFGSPSLAYCYGRLNTYNWQYTIEKFQTGFVSTSSSATDPSVSVTKALSYYRQHFCIAWEENNQLKFRKYAQDSLNYNSITTFGNTYTVSSGSGYPVNTKPSVFAVSDTSARIVWNGIYDDGADHFSVAIFKATDNNQFWNFGDNVNNVNLNGSSTRYAVAWAKMNSTIEYTDNTTLSNITTLSNASNFSGKYIQISNGTNPVDFRALTLNTPSNPPNYFQTKQIYSVNKENASSISSGRGGCVFTDDYQFYFSIGDVSVNGNAVKFVDLADSVSVKSANTLNKYLVTEPFAINDNAKFEYSALFGVIDSAAAFKALKTGDAVKFKVELIDDKTGSVISSFDNLTFSKDKITKRGYKTYSVSAKGLGNITVRLRLVTESNINADYAINNIYATGSVLKKSAAEELEIKNASVVKEYALEQNYPNPFNPSTVINYQIPNANKVSLKVYDVLGKEIATLVDGYKETSRYQVTFDCGKLASGVYIYKLESGKFVQSRKMILTK